jgi:DNA-binding response OmpR family regulator
MKILIVEDDNRIAQPLAEDLQHQNHAVDVALDGELGWDCVQVADYDLILLDVMLPKLDGISLCKRIRQRESNVYILMLTARDTTQDKVIGLDAGADDYLIKPFDFTELLARLSALIRPPPLQVDPLLRVGNLEMDTIQHSVKYGDRTINLSPREYSLLEYLMRNPNQVLSRTQIAQRVWSFDFYGDYKVIDVYIGYLRRKLDRESSHSLIQTIRGVGYCMIAPSE